MNQSKFKIANSKLFLGVDGGQSHTEAVIADENGNLLGQGFGGASNHAEQPGGRERLKNAILSCIGEALENAGLPPLDETIFAAAHFGMTGGADYKEEIIGSLVRAEKLTIGHDAPVALSGATVGEPGIIVIAGTGSVIYGENARGETARAGGLGFLFSDEGSGFWLAVQTVKLAIQEQDGLIPPCGLQKLILEFFQVAEIRDLTTAFYNGKISRDRLASVAKAAHEAATNGNEMLAAQINFGAKSLAENVRVVARKLNFERKFPVAGVGGMFRAALMKKRFAEALSNDLPNAVFSEPRFGSAIGALLLAYRQAGIAPEERLLANLEKSQI
jgi:N-acetylglucosamine kinase-like BadF-type ATPase